MDRSSHAAMFNIRSASPLSTPAIAADDRQNFTGDIARALRRGQKYVRRSNLLRLRRTFHRRLGAELGYIFRALVGRIERRPDRTRRHGVHPNTARYQIGCQRACESMDAALGHGVVEQALVAEQP